MPAAIWCLGSQEIFFRTNSLQDLRNDEGNFFFVLEKHSAAGAGWSQGVWACRYSEISAFPVPVQVNKG